MHEPSEALVVAMDGNDGALEGFEAPHVAVANHDQQQKHTGKKDFKLQQGEVFQLLKVVDLLEDPVGVEQHKGPVEHLPQQGVVGAHRSSLAPSDIPLSPVPRLRLGYSPAVGTTERGSHVVLLNLWSLGHFVQWTFIGRFLLTNWWVFLALSVGWEVLELYLPFEFVEETWDNKLSDLVVNTVGFALGLGLRYDPQTLD